MPKGWGSAGRGPGAPDSDCCWLLVEFEWVAMDASGGVHPRPGASPAPLPSQALGPPGRPPGRSPPPCSGGRRQGPSWSPSSQPLADPLGTERALPPHSFLPQQTWPPSLGGGAHTPRPGRGAGEIKQYTVLPRKSDSASEGHPCPAGSDLESTARAQASETGSAQGPAGPPSTQPQNAPRHCLQHTGPGCHAVCPRAPHATHWTAVHFVYSP